MAGKYSKTNNHSNLNNLDGPDGHDEQDDAYTKESSFLNERWSPGAVGTLHQFSDNDSSQLAQHHTLGPRHNQSAPGDHNHDGGTSKPLFHTFSGTGTTTAGGALIIDTGAPFATVSAAIIQYDQTLRTAGPSCTATWYDSWTPASHLIGSQWYNPNGTVINAGVVFYRGVVFP